MSRRLKMALRESIQTLHRSGHSNRSIADLLSIDRGTVARYIAEFKAGCAGADSSSKPARPDHRVADPKPAKPDHRGGPPNACIPFADLIHEKLEMGLSGVRIYQDLRDEHGFTASYSSVRRFLQQSKRSNPIPFRRMETAPGEEAQIDFGTGAPIVTDTGRRKTWVFRIVLSNSRKAYSQVVLRQNTDSFIEALENAFHYFGGSPRRLVTDNLKAVVPQADWYDPVIHPRLQSFAKHYETVFLPTRPYTPRHKGKVESGVKYIKLNALRGRKFLSLAEQNQFIQDWECRIADTRIHGTTKQQVQKLFLLEQPSLTPLPRDRFPDFKEARCHVHMDGHVEVDKSYYSVPPAYMKRRLWARWDSRVVRIYDEQMNHIVTHPRASLGKFQSLPQHIPDRKVSAVEKGIDWQLGQIGVIGEHARQWAMAAVQAHGLAAPRILLGLRSLAKKYRFYQVNHACRIALGYGAFRLKTIRRLIARQDAPVQEQFEFIEEHPIIRDINTYSAEMFLSERRTFTE